MKLSKSIGSGGYWIMSLNSGKTDPKFTHDSAKNATNWQRHLANVDKASVKLSQNAETSEDVVRCSAYYPSYVSVEGYIGCCFSLCLVTDIGDGGTDRCEILHDGTYRSRQIFSPPGAVPRGPQIRNFWA